MLHGSSPASLTVKKNPDAKAGFISEGKNQAKGGGLPLCKKCTVSIFIGTDRYRTISTVAYSGEIKLADPDFFLPDPTFMKTG